MRVTEHLALRIQAVARPASHRGPEHGARGGSRTCRDGGDRPPDPEYARPLQYRQQGRLEASSPADRTAPRSKCGSRGGIWPSSTPRFHPAREPPARGVVSATSSAPCRKRSQHPARVQQRRVPPRVVDVPGQITAHLGAKPRQPLRHSRSVEPNERIPRVTQVKYVDPRL